MVRVDSVMMRDSVVARSEGDTLLIEKWRWRDRVSVVRDTVVVMKNDSVGVPYPVERPLTRWEKVKMDFGGTALGVVGVVLIWFIIRLTRKSSKI